MLNHLQAIAPQPAFNAPVMRCDGAWRLNRGANLTGSADSKLLAASFWFKPTIVTDSKVIWSGTITLASNDYRVLIWTDTDGTINVHGGTSGAGNILNVKTTASALTVSKWHHIWLSFDVANAANRHITIDGVNRLGTVTNYVNTAFEGTLGDWCFGSHPGGTFPIVADIAEFWFNRGYGATGDYVLFNDNGRPRYLGEDGSYPYGVAPLVYLSGGITNKGSGGGFTLTGTFANGTAIG